MHAHPVHLHVDLFGAFEILVRVPKRVREQGVLRGFNVAFDQIKIILVDGSGTLFQCFQLPNIVENDTNFERRPGGTN